MEKVICGEVFKILEPMIKNFKVPTSSFGLSKTRTTAATPTTPTASRPSSRGWGRCLSTSSCSWSPITSGLLRYCFDNYSLNVSVTFCRKLVIRSFSALFSVKRTNSKNHHLTWYLELRPIITKELSGHNALVEDKEKCFISGCGGRELLRDVELAWPHRLHDPRLLQLQDEALHRLRSVRWYRSSLSCILIWVCQTYETGGCIAQREHSYFPPSSPGFYSRCSWKFFSGILGCRWD